MPDIHDDLAKLRSRLAISAKLYQGNVLEHQRRSVMSALCAVADFLEAQDFPPESLPPVLRPALALAERENNNLDQMFSQRERGGRPKATMDQHDRTGILAAFANAWLLLCQNDDRPQRIKLSEAARKMSGGGFGDVNGSNLKTAREVVSREAKNHPAAMVAKTFDDLFTSAVELVGRARSFQFMLDFVNDAPAAQIKGIWKTPAVSSADEG